MLLISHLSNINHPSSGEGFIEAPDGKINERFSEHSEFLKSEYQDLYIQYGNVLKDIEELSEIGTVKIKRLGLYLKTYSDKILSESNGDAKIALDKLVDNFSDVLSNNGKNYDKIAIRFFIVNQLIKCNVFPNRVLK
ncbi:MAG: hypothetical protein F4223_06145 [Rhodobacteraceae bacterium]|nr:hypothetical protein [Paracoccaceae bacterium]